MTAAVKGVSYNNTDGTSGYNFISKVPTVYNNNRIVASFSGESLPKDVVTHEQLNIRIQSYQVGDIYLTTSSQNPKIRFGYGTWERFAEGEVLVGFSTSVSNDVPQWVKTAGNRFGNYEHKLTVDEMPSHTHNLKIFDDNNNHDKSDEGDRGVSRTGNSQTGFVEETGGSSSHNNVQPSVVVYMWKRIE